MKIFTSIKANPERYLLFLLFIITVLPRFLGLGYSEFYGDETKVLYLNKSVTAPQFFLNQRKGPVSFGVAWFVENLTGGYDELAIRLPFAVAGTMSVFVLYLVVRKWFGWQTALIAALLFSVNGLFIAFSRTAQYQAFLWLFGLSAIWYAQRGRVLFSGAFLGLCLLTHYDGLFFILPTLLSLWERGLSRRAFGRRVVGFAAVGALVAGAFYAPYLLGGYFSENTVGYITRRLNGESPFSIAALTYLLYNPFVLSIPLLLLGLGVFVLKVVSRNLKLVLGSWLLLPLVSFIFIFSDPGTHIQQFVIPLVIMAAAVLYKMYSFSARLGIQGVLTGIAAVTASGYLYYNFMAFIPAFDKGYPWEESYLIDRESDLYIYGFTYHRGWKQVSEHLKESGAKTFYTNDNVTIASYYLLGIPADKQEPHFYVEIAKNQMFRPLNRAVFGSYEYVLDAVIRTEGSDTAKIYKRLEVI